MKYENVLSVVYTVHARKWDGRQDCQWAGLELEEGRSEADPRSLPIHELR